MLLTGGEKGIYVWRFVCAMPVLSYLARHHKTLQVVGVVKAMRVWSIASIWLAALAFSQCIVAQELTGATNLVASDADGGVSGTAFASKECLLSEGKASFSIYNNFLAYSSVDFKVELQCNRESPTTKGLPSQRPGAGDIKYIAPQSETVRGKACSLRLYGIDPTTGLERLFRTEQLDCGPIFDDDDDDDGCQYDDDDNDGFFDIPGHIEHQNVAHSFPLYGIAFIVLGAIIVTVGFVSAGLDIRKKSKHLSETYTPTSTPVKQLHAAELSKWLKVRNSALKSFQGLS